MQPTLNKGNTLNFIISQGQNISRIAADGVGLSNMMLVLFLLVFFPDDRHSHKIMSVLKEIMNPLMLTLNVLQKVEFETSQP